MLWRVGRLALRVHLQVVRLPPHGLVLGPGVRAEEKEEEEVVVVAMEEEELASCTTRLFWRDRSDPKSTIMRGTRT
jgi:hypothetical protein